MCCLGVIGKLVKHESQLRREVVSVINTKLRTFLLLLVIKQATERPPRCNYKRPVNPNDIQKLR